MSATIEPADVDLGVPPGTAALGVALAHHAAELAGALTGHAHAVDHEIVFAHLLMPLVVGDRPEPPPPRPAPAGGAVHVDVIADDEALLAALIADRPDADAEAVAAVAQECRLPVTPYRSRARAAHRGGATESLSAGFGGVPRRRRRSPRDVTILDLTAMWAGPLCTALLAEWGADVVTVESSARRDGLRGSPRQFRVLDRGKRRVDLDLRQRPDRERFEELVRRADVIVDSFSSRVLPCWGYDPEGLARVNPRISSVAVRAFADDAPERDWVGYGRGVHAASGLAVHEGRPMPALLAYPDPLTALAATAAVFELLAADAPQHRVVSLSGTIAPLGRGPERPPAEGDPAVVDRLRARVRTAAWPPLLRPAAI